MRKWLPTLAAVAVLAWGVLLPCRVLAWGQEGHELVGRIADKHLNSRARQAIDELLQGSQFRSLSDGRLTNWADAIKRSAFYQRKYAKNPQWHFIDISVTAVRPSISSLMDMLAAITPNKPANSIVIA